LRRCNGNNSNIGEYHKRIGKLVCCMERQGFQILPLPIPQGGKMEQDLSYLRTAYAREKMIEEYNHDEPKEVEDEQGEPDSRQDS
jgi:hypothetical protein